MPFKSKNQEKWMKVNRPGMAKKWAKKYGKAKDLNDKVKGAMK